MNQINNCSNWVVYLGYNNFIDWTLVRVWSECVIKQVFEMQNWSYDWSECWIVGRVIGCEKIGHRLGLIFIVVRTWSAIGRVLVGYCWSKCGQRGIIGQKPMTPR